MSTEFPFVFGAQYYRAPTPAPECWERDLQHCRQLGFNTVKFWVQWRWSERQPGVYEWSDLDKLMRLAERFSLRVILNLICDVMPLWAQTKYPDCRMVDRHGQPVLTSANLCRQLGGYPGPCLNHPGMRAARQAFLAAAVRHFQDFPALLSWDVWNEPEHDLEHRAAVLPDDWLCYCPHCAAAFRQWLARRYVSIDALNQRWGRCYENFGQVELPANAETIADFIDWRLFHLESMTREAEMRLAVVQQLAPQRFPHLHVVPNTICGFNSTSGVDDFALAGRCSVFGASLTAWTLGIAETSSAAGQKFLYNAEWHINYGMTSQHQRLIDRDTFLREAIPQLAWNVRGFLFWQFRAETLGFESPAWGLVNPDGTDRPCTNHAREFLQVLSPHLETLRNSRREEPPCAILKSLRGELFFNAFPHDRGNWLCRALAGYLDALQAQGIPFRFLSSEQLESGKLDAVKLLILPAAYYLSQKEADAVDAFLRAGGTVLCEGTVAGYNHDRGRHEEVVPGCGLASRWGIREQFSVAARHLPNPASPQTPPPQEEDYFALTSTTLGAGWGALNFSCCLAPSGTVLADFDGQPVVTQLPVGAGQLYYAGTYLGAAAAEISPAFLEALMAHAAHTACFTVAPARGLRCTPLYSPEHAVVFYVLENGGEAPQQLSFSTPVKDLFYDQNGTTINIAPHHATILAVQ